MKQWIKAFGIAFGVIYTGKNYPLEGLIVLAIVVLAEFTWTIKERLKL